ncbi:3642_t:CDS:2 [Ambispora gerdemannii]|uniref:3642_t:CDS:1 n=1 Tax=Ambispora gerdemannii TaxID=144530 RepID=A0A9N9FNK0_9GLOM|nr:3642_t:CDS:2 [Ambispora gerdemannii]
MDAETLFNKLLVLVDILKYSKTTSVLQWDTSYLQDTIQCAYEVEKQVLCMSEQEFVPIYQKILEITRSGNAQHSINEIARIRHSIYFSLLGNNNLPAELYYYVLSTYPASGESGLGVGKDALLQDIQKIGKTCATADVLLGMGLTLQENLMTINKQCSYERPEQLSVIYEFSFRLLPDTITKRATARPLLDKFISLFDENGEIAAHFLDQIREEAVSIPMNNSEGMQIIAHLIILTDENDYKNSYKAKKVQKILLDWILSIIHITDTQQYEMIPVQLENQFWMLHPWILAQLSSLSYQIFDLYSQTLINCMNQEKKIHQRRDYVHCSTTDGNDDSIIITQLYYRKIEPNRQETQNYEASDDIFLLKRLSEHWIALKYQKNERVQFLTNQLLENDWFAFKNCLNPYSTREQSKFEILWIDFYNSIGML